MEKYPEISFRSTGVEAKDDANYRVTGDLTLHGTTKPVVLEVEYAGRTADPGAASAPASPPRRP